MRDTVSVFLSPFHGFPSASSKYSVAEKDTGYPVSHSQSL